MEFYVLSDEAEERLEEIRSKTEDDWGYTQSVKYLSKLEKDMEFLSRTPYAGKNRSGEFSEEVRTFPSGSHLIYYMIIEDGIFVTTVLHQKQLPQKHLEAPENEDDIDLV